MQKEQSKLLLQKKRYETWNLTILVFGRLVSNLGSGILNFALGLYVLEITQAAGKFSFTLSISTIALIVVNTFMGVFVDRYNKKKIIAGSDILSGMMVFAYLLLAQVWRESYLLILLYTIAISMLQAIFTLATSAALPNLVAVENVPRANAILQSITSGANVVGPIIGAILYKSFGIHIIFCINGIALILSGITETWIQFHQEENKNKPKQRRRYLEDFKISYHYIKSEKILIFFFTFAAVISLIYMPLVYMVLTYINYHILQVSELQLSLIQSSVAIGCIVGALLLVIKKDLSCYMMKHFPTLFQIQAILFLLWMFPMMTETFHMGKMCVTVIFSAILFLTSVINMLQNIPLMSYFQARIPNQIRGRVFGTFMSAAYIFSPFGMWIYGFFLEIVPWYSLTFVSGMIMMLIAVRSKKNISYKKFVQELEGKTPEKRIIRSEISIQEG